MSDCASSYLSPTFHSLHVHPMSSVTIVERSDIHKSCMSIEAVVNILNDYCEAANAIVTIQKKLAKALRESATAKGTTEIAGMCFFDTIKEEIFERVGLYSECFQC